MKGMILDKPSSLDIEGSLASVEVLRENEPTKEDATADYLFIPDSESTLPINLEVPIFMEAGYFDLFHNQPQGYVYCELAASPIGQKWLAILEKDEAKKGVLRIHRDIDGKDAYPRICGDLFALVDVFGDVADLHVRTSTEQHLPTHVIALVKFVNGAMAHLEYTSADKEELYFDWSGFKTIIEFDSKELTSPPGTNHYFPLAYTVEHIVKAARKMNEERYAKWQELGRRMREGGVKA
ncbi:hypothetical protein [Oceanobacillus kapialis]|uniref:Uncharacterized protein n=1 Tax=Oceanobacillus kapialis TaxID=481353 RepID=A0ABW5PX96_9BACI